MSLFRGEDVLIAQIESRVERKEYQKKGRCIRFTAIRTKDLLAFADNNGVTTLTVDLSYWEFCRSKVGNRWLTKEVQQKIDFGQDNESSWYEVRVHWNAMPAHGYAYSTFSNEVPTSFSLITCTPIENPLQSSSTSNISVMAQAPSKNHLAPKVFGTGKKWTLWGFHVGQGMCALLTDTLTHGVLLDAGLEHR